MVSVVNPLYWGCDDPLRRVRNLDAISSQFSLIALWIPCPFQARIPSGVRMHRLSSFVTHSFYRVDHWTLNSNCLSGWLSHDEYFNIYPRMNAGIPFVVLSVPLASPSWCPCQVAPPPCNFVPRRTFSLTFVEFLVISLLSYNTMFSPG